jgi:hypothetical protein
MDQSLPEFPFDADITDFLNSVNDRKKIHEIADQLPVGAQVVLIMKRPSDDSVAFQTFGGIDAKDVTYMLAHTQARIFDSRSTT